MAERPDPARFCYGCGTDNEHGLRMEFRLEDGRAVAGVTPEAFLQGYPGHVHGGGIATMLDEAMGWAVYAQGIWAMTARLNVRFRAPALVGQAATVTGWLSRDRGRFLELRAEIAAADGRLIAEADGLFVRVDGESAERIREQYEAARS